MKKKRLSEKNICWPDFVVVLGNKAIEEGAMPKSSK